MTWWSAAGAGRASLHGLCQLGDGSVQLSIGSPVLALLLRQLVLDVEQHCFDYVQLVGHLRLDVVQSILNLP